MDRQAPSDDTVLVKSREMTGPNFVLLAERGEVKTTENKIHWPRCYLPPCLPLVGFILSLLSHRVGKRVSPLRTGCRVVTPAAILCRMCAVFGLELEHKWPEVSCFPAAGAAWAILL
jgi:hypothetical protein